MTGRTGYRSGRERGAMAIGLAIVLLLGVLFVALVLDVGRWYMEDRRLQKAVDTVAMQYAMHDGYCAGESMGQDPAAGEVEAALVDQDLRNPVTVMNAVFGFMDREDGVRQFVADSDQPEAFLLRAQQEIPRSIVVGALFPGTVTLEKTAVAQRVPVATFSVGSWLARVDSSNSGLLNALLGGLLGSSLDLSAVSYQGIADAEVSIADLLGAGEIEIGAEAGTVEGLLDADVTLGQLGQLMASALQRGSGSQADIDGLLGPIQLAPLPEAFRLGDILAIDSGAAGAATDATVRAADLLLAGAMIANANNAVNVDLDGISLNVPGLASLDTTAQLAVIEPPRIAVGRPGLSPSGEPFAEARNAQVRLQLGLNASVGLSIPLLPSLVEVPLNVAVDAANANARLDSIRCRRLAREDLDAGLTLDSSAVDVQLGTFSDLGAADGVIEPGGSGVSVLGGTLTLNISGDFPVAAMAGGDVMFEGVSRDQLPEPASASLGQSGSVVGPASGNFDIDGSGLIGSLVNPLSQTVSGVLLPLLDLVVSAIVNPLLELLGISAAGADVELIDIDDGRTELIL